MSDQSSATIRRLFRFLTFCIFLPLLAVEGTLIIADPLLPAGMYQYDRDLGFRVRAGVLGANSFGFNDDEHTIAKPDGTFRILILGDSFSWAGGKNNYTRVLEQQFAQAVPERRIEVINAGYPMLGTWEEAALLEKYGLQFKPDLVILSFFVGNDFIESVPTRKRLVLNDTYFDIDRRQEIEIAGYPIPPQPRFPAFIRQKWVTFSEQFHLWLNHEQGQLMRDESFLEVEAKRLRFCHTDPLSASMRSVQSTYTTDAIREIKNILAADHIPFRVVIIPDDSQVDDTLYRRILERTGDKESDYNRFCFQQILKDYLSAEQIGYVDLLPVFRSHPQPARLYVERDTHWSDAGNHFAAQSIAEYLLPFINQADQ